MFIFKISLKVDQITKSGGENIGKLYQFQLMRKTMVCNQYTMQKKCYQLLTHKKHQLQEIELQKGKKKKISPLPLTFGAQLQKMKDVVHL